MSKQILTRFAPTPSGFLHLGNVYSFLITWLIAKKKNGRILLRIDDIDKERKRDQYVENIFETLEWLSLDFDIGPTSVDDFNNNFSQFKRMDLYRDALEELKKKGVTFNCDCSRKEVLLESSDGIYQGRCKSRGLIEKPNQVIRLDTDNRQIEEFQDELRGNISVQQNITTKDFVLWTKLDRPSYQLTSIVDDHFYSVNCVVRGEDLLDSSAAQLILAEQLSQNTFSNSQFFHHGMILAHDNSKLSKSQSAPSVFDKFSQPEELFCHFGRNFGLEFHQSYSLDTLLSNFNLDFLKNE